MFFKDFPRSKNTVKVKKYNKLYFNQIYHRKAKKW